MNGVMLTKAPISKLYQIVKVVVLKMTDAPCSMTSSLRIVLSILATTKPRLLSTADQ